MKTEITEISPSYQLFQLSFETFHSLFIESMNYLKRNERLESLSELKAKLSSYPVSNLNISPIHYLMR